MKLQGKKEKKETRAFPTTEKNPKKQQTSGKKGEQD